MRWKQLHRLAYLIGAAGVLHYFLRVKQDVTQPVVYGGILLAGFGVRVGDWLRRRQTRKS